jgi:hypothetical protein
MAGFEFLESFFGLAKKKLKPEDMDELFRSARAASGGRGKKKKRLERENEEVDTEKALVERPLNSRGLGTDSTLSVVQDQGKFSKEQARYFEPADNSYATCGGCRFYLRDDNSEIGRCQAVEGDIAWFGTSDYFLSASDEAYHAFERVHGAEIYAAKEEDDETYKVEKKVEQRGDKWVVLDSAGKKVLGTHDSKESAVRQLQAIEANKSEEDWSVSVEFYKEDLDKQLVFGIVMEPEVIDSQGDFSTEEEIEKAAHGFLRKSRIIGNSHKLKAKAEVVESYIAREAAVVEGQEVKKGSWIMVVKIHDGELWEGVKSGDFNGFSIGGKATRIEGEEFGETEEEEEE